MINRTTRLRWRRRLRTSKRQVEDIGFQAEEHLDKHLIKRMTKLPGVLRFTSTWILLVLLLIGGVVVQARSLSSQYLVDKPVPGGLYTEGILGTFTNSNPLFATSPVDSSVSHLIYSGLLRLDSNNKLMGDLAKSWEVDENELNYTFRLHDNLKWHDGQPLTSEDVVFTYQTIQNPDARSPLFAGWQGITVTAPDKNTVVFTLPNALSSFAYSLSNGIVPKHILKDVPLEQLRSVEFNSTKPVGAGPFKLSAIEVKGDTPESREEQIAMVPFEDYVKGKPKLNKFNIRSFHSRENLTASFNRNELSGVVGLVSLPEDQTKDSTTIEYHIPLQGQVVVFLKTTEAPLNDVNVRKALVMGTNNKEIISKLGFPVLAANSPLLKQQLGYDKTLVQLGYDVNAAKKLLDENGWVPDNNGVRTKNGAKLKIALYSQDDTEYSSVAQELKKQWQALGVETELNLQSAADLQSKQLPTHSYGALLYGIEIGPDPDVFAYWHSSQADIRSQRLNFSEYKSPVADAALGAGRIRRDPALRVIKYQPFLNAWKNDAPAIALYQPRFYYVTRGKVFGFNPTSMPNAVNRYANVYNWMIREDKLPKE